MLHKGFRHDMATTETQPIAGVSTGAEVEAMTVFPSIGSTWLGRLLSNLYESIPLGNGQVKLSHLLFPLPTAPLALLLYATTKIFGHRYRLSNRSVSVRTFLGNRLVKQVDLLEIDEVVLSPRHGHEFYRCADIELMGQDGSTLLTLAAVPRAEVFRTTILKARDAAMQVKASLAAIEARQPV